MQRIRDERTLQFWILNEVKLTEKVAWPELPTWNAKAGVAGLPQSTTAVPGVSPLTM